MRHCGTEMQDNGKAYVCQTCGKAIDYVNNPKKRRPKASDRDKAKTTIEHTGEYL